MENKTIMKIGTPSTTGFRWGPIHFILAIVYGLFSAAVLIASTYSPMLFMAAFIGLPGLAIAVMVAVELFAGRGKGVR